MVGPQEEFLLQMLKKFFRQSLEQFMEEYLGRMPILEEIFKKSLEVSQEESLKEFL